jgi:hypothetical protein
LLGKLLGESMQEFIPISSRPVTKLCESYYRNSCRVRKPVGKLLLDELLPKLSLGLESCLGRQLLGNLALGESSLHPSHVPTAREREEINDFLG